MSFFLEMVPSEDRKSLTIRIMSPDSKIGVKDMVSILAHFLEQQIEEHGIALEDSSEVVSQRMDAH